MTADLQPDLERIIRARDFSTLRGKLENWEPADLASLIISLPVEDQVVVFRVLPRGLAADVFEYLDLAAQELLLKTMATDDVAALLNDMAPDDRTHLLDELPAAVTKQMLSLLTSEERIIAISLLGYPEESIGRLMTPDYVSVRQDWTVEQVLAHIRSHGQDSETLSTIYVVDEEGVLIDSLRIRSILLASPATRVSELMDRRVVALKASDDQETAISIFRREDCTALPVTDSLGILIGIVTVDDVLDVAEAEATEDIQKIGGVQALEEPFLQIPLARLIRKRANWLVILFFGELLTATAMGLFEKEIERAVVLALFVPLIISSGGNSGSQASTLVIRALALRGDSRARLVARDATRGPCRAGARFYFRRYRVLADRALGGLLPCLWRTLVLGSVNRRAGAHRYRALGNARWLNAPFRHATVGFRSRNFFGALCGDVGRCYRAVNLLRHCRGRPTRHIAIEAP
jgi:magnesium transporter